MKSEDEFTTLLGILLNMAKQIPNIVQRMEKLVQKREIKLQYIDNSTFIRLFCITARTSVRWRNEHRIRFIRKNHRIWYRNRDVFNYFETQNRKDMKHLLDAWWEIKMNKLL